MRKFPHAPGPYKKMARRNKFSDIFSIVSMKHPTIVDGGAHTGGCLKEFRKHYPIADIHMFEPTPALCAHLRKKQNKHTHIHEVALGAEDKTAKFNILSRSPTSSMLKPSRLMSEKQEEKEVQKEINVSCRRLDSVLTSAPDILKLDVQGYELEVLKGCSKFLHNIRVITLEVEFIPLYIDQPLFSDIDMFLRDKGFFLFNLYELHTRRNGQLSMGDAIYLNASLYARSKGTV